MRDRSAEIAEIKAKGFNLRSTQNYSNDGLNFSKVKIGPKSFNDPTYLLESLTKSASQLSDKNYITDAIERQDLAKLREISEFYYKTNGIYKRILNYMAKLYRYDWYVTPYVNDSSIKQDKLLQNFHSCLSLLDNFGVKKQFSDIALKVLKKGCYYGYKVETGNSVVLQELPPDYCRVAWYVNDKPLVEFQMKFFDDYGRNAAMKMKLLKAFPEEFSKGYLLYKQGKLKTEDSNDNGWFPLDPTRTVKFNISGDDSPVFVSTVPLLVDLSDAQALDKKKTLQRLLKIIIQKLPLDKNGELIFDVDEGQQLHNNVVQMVANAIGVDVLTTFADVQVENLADSSVASAQSDDLERVERQVFNGFGTAENLFNANGNLSLDKSIVNDEASMYDLLLQFQDFLNGLLDKFNKNKKLSFKVQMLTTTIYNYKELSKLYKEQMQLGFSKMLPQIALGQTQSSILANAYFENEVLDLVNVFIPPLMSSTMNSDILNRKQNKGDGGGRPTNEEQGKPMSDKTIQNKESQS